MADVRYVAKQGQGDILCLYMTDGSRQFAMRLPNGQWRNYNIGSGIAEPPASGAGGMITAQMIEAAVQSAGGSPGNMVATSQQIADSFNAAVQEVDPGLLSTKNRAACLVGECAQETAWYQTTTEYGGGAGQSYYPYCGRGFIQCTWDYNYKLFGAWCVSKGVGGLTDPDYFYNNPTQLAALNWAPYTAIWYFSNIYSGKTLWKWCDESTSPWKAVSACINNGNPYGTPNHLSQRAAAIDAALAVTPDPNAGGGTTPGSVQDKLVKWIKDHGMMYRYSMAPGRESPDATGYTDCSALMQYCYKQVAGIEIGLWTGGQQDYGTIVISQGSGQLTNTSSLKPGDLVFFNWTYWNPKFDHVEMYLGSGDFGADTISGHGGPGMGPFQKSLAQQTGYAVGGWRVRRYV